MHFITCLETVIESVVFRSVSIINVWFAYLSKFISHFVSFIIKAPPRGPAGCPMIDEVN